MCLTSVIAFSQSENDVIDYANSITSEELKELLYVYASDYFEGRDFDAIPFVFRKPVAFIFLPFGHLKAENEKDLLITKHHYK